MKDDPMVQTSGWDAMSEFELFQTLAAAREAGNLARVIQEHVEQYRSLTGISRGKLIKRLSEAAGIHETTVYGILNGTIKRPPDRRLWGFARVLSRPDYANGMRSTSELPGVSRPASFDVVYEHLRALIDDGIEIQPFNHGEIYRIERSNEDVMVASAGETKRLPKAWLETACHLLERRGILSVEDLPGELSDTPELLILLGSLPYTDCAAWYRTHDGRDPRPKFSVFLIDHVFTNGQLSDVFGVSNSGGIRYSGSAADPQLVVFISGGSNLKSSIPYRDRWEGDRFHYTGEGLRGDQTLTRGNLALKSSAENGCPVFGFEKLGPDRYKYLGRFRVVEIGEETQPDVDGNDRRVYVFQMELVDQEKWAKIAPLLADNSGEPAVREREAFDGPSFEFLGARKYKTSPLPAGWNWREQMQALIARVLDTGFFFEPWEIAAYVTALRTKPFVILAGISGTGKSKLPQLVARTIGCSFELIPVRPDWTDSSELLGYVDLAGTFRPGRLLQLAREAESDPGRGFVVVLDEMNLARVEHYFAEVLSRIEERLVAGTSWFCNPLIRLTGQEPGPAAEWEGVGLPPNLAIVGTVNMDESTHGFSRKVLDRAFTLELSDVKLDRWGAPNLGSESPNGSGARGGPAGEAPAVRTNGPLNWPASVMIPKYTSLAGASDLTPAEQEAIEQVISHLQRLNEELKAAQLQVGYRVRDEVALFVINAMSVADSFVTTDGERVDPLDLAISMKVLPRIIGGSSAIRRVLAGVLAWATDRSRLDDRDVERLVDEWRDQGRPASLLGYRFPRCAARLCLMWERLMDDGFTSYWL